MVVPTHTSRLRIGVAAIVLALMVVGVVLSSRPVGAQVDVHAFLPAETIRHRFQDFDDDGLRLGDRLTGRGPLFDASQQSEFGVAYQECVVMRRITDGPSGPSGLYRCTYELVLADGSIVVEGLDPHGPGVYTFSVLGGTGAYARATGDATLTDSSEGTDFVIDLTG
jgi:hypothetical protein